MNPQIDASGIIANDSVRLISNFSLPGIIPRMSFFREWSGQQAYPAAGLMILALMSLAFSSSFRRESSHSDTASARVIFTERRSIGS